MFEAGATRTRPTADPPSLLPTIRLTPPRPSNLSPFRSVSSVCRSRGTLVRRKGGGGGDKTGNNCTLLARFFPPIFFTGSFIR